uniref:Uncharacterized protein n=1 Tax=Arundo donax TaxID=35708 RepID=A0A0A9TJG6_ARUDO
MASASAGEISSRFPNGDCDDGPAAWCSSASGAP